MLDQFEDIRDKLIGLNANEVRKVLGKPDKVELYRRSQRFYIYFFEAGGQCKGSGKGTAEGRNFYVRFNTLDQVSEISLHLPNE